MIISNLILIILSIFNALYAIPYANYELKSKNKLSAIAVYAIALMGISLSIFKVFI